MMNSKLLTIVHIAIIATALTACGAAKSSIAADGKESNNEPVILLQATKQTTLPGRPEMQPTTDHRFVVVWKKQTSPTAIFWRGESGWLSCNTSIVTNYKKLDEDNPGMNDNYQTQVMKRSISSNDTLELYPVRMGKHPMPESIPADATNTIFFKTGDNDWHALKVEKIIERPEIAMP